MFVRSEGGYTRVVPLTEPSTEPPTVRQTNALRAAYRKCSVDLAETRDRLRSVEREMKAMARTHRAEIERLHIEATVDREPPAGFQMLWKDKRETERRFRTTNHRLRACEAEVRECKDAAVRDRLTPPAGS